VETIREILASHESGISRDGLLAWARLRGDPTMTDAQLEAALAELGDQVVDDQGFLYLRQNAPASALRDSDAAAVAAAATTSAAPPAAWSATGASPADGASIPPSPPAAWTPAADGAEPGASAPPGAGGWLAPDGTWAPGTPDGTWEPAPQPGNKRTMVVATVGVAVFLIAAAGGAILLRGSDGGSTTADATPAVPTPTSGSVVGAFTIGVGDCLILPSEDQFDEVRRLDCSEAHNGEIFLVQAHPGDTYPSDAEFTTYVEKTCVPAFATYTGSALADQDVLEYGWFTPTEGSWSNGDHDVACYLSPVDGGQTSRSYRDANP
jgi:uncharacterized membrane protein